MNLDELKAQHPDLYNQIFQAGTQAGIKSERDRVKAHLNWHDAAPDRVKEAIDKGEEFSMTSLSEYSKAAQNKTDVKDRIDDNPDATKEQGAEDEKEAETKLLAATMQFSKKQVGR